jgi:hypothetical protein
MLNDLASMLDLMICIIYLEILMAQIARVNMDFNLLFILPKKGYYGSKWVKKA